mgnify:CR=1 FL=1
MSIFNSNLIPQEYIDYKVFFQDGGECEIQAAIVDESSLAPFIALQALHIATVMDIKLDADVELVVIPEHGSFPLRISSFNYNNKGHEHGSFNRCLRMSVKHFFAFFFPQGITQNEASKNIEEFLSFYMEYFVTSYKTSGFVKNTEAITQVYKGYKAIYNEYITLECSASSYLDLDKVANIASNKKNLASSDENNKHLAPLSNTIPTDLNTLLERPCDVFSELLEKLSFIAKAEYKNKLLDDKALLTAIAVSPMIRVHIQQTFMWENDLFFPKQVTSLLNKINQTIDTRLIPSGDDEGKSWFSADVPTLKKSHFDERLAIFFASITVEKDGQFHLAPDFIESAVCNYLASIDKPGEKPTSLLASFCDINEKLNDKRYKQGVIVNIRNSLNKSVIGMEDAKKGLINILNERLDGYPAQQRGPMFIYGSSGVGKTMIAKEFVKAINNEFHDNYVLQLINMEQMQTDKDLGLLFGSGYQYNVANLGLLTSQAEFQPKRVIVFDEIEKAHSSTIISLLSLLSELQSIDKSSLRNVDFSQCIIIFTSNLGQENSNFALSAQINFQSVLASAFSPEFINRISLGHIAHCSSLNCLELKSFLDTASSQMSEYGSQYFPEIIFDDSLSLGIAYLTQGLTPRSILGQISKLKSRINNTLTSYETDLDKTKSIYVGFKFESSFGFDEFLAEYRLKEWLVEISTKVIIEPSTEQLQVTFSVSKPKLAINQKDLKLPFLNFIDSSEVNFESLIGNCEVISELKVRADGLKECSIENRRASQGGIILSGPPGSGKTHMARAMANYFDGMFIQVNASELTIGDADKNIKQCFDVVNRYSPCILFIDEIDSVACKRSPGKSNINMMVNSLLTGIDGFYMREKEVLVIGATNNYEHLDPAMIRPGRLGVHLQVELPCESDITELIIRKVNLPIEQVSINTIKVWSEQLYGFQALKINELIEKVIATAKNSNLPLQNIFQQALLVGKLGDETGSIRNQDDDISIVYHEAGHAIALSMLFSVDEIFAIDVHSRSECEGAVLTRSYKKRNAQNRLFIKKEAQIRLAGRAAELLFWKCEDRLSLGAANDISKATYHIRKAITHYGFSLDNHIIDYSQFSSQQLEVQEEVKLWMKDAHEKVTHLLDKNWHLVEKLASALIDNRTLFKENIEQLLFTKNSIKLLH